jgi:hypothetical protein
MIQSLENWIAILALTTTLSAMLLFLPAIIELRKPKDAGPRLIPDYFVQMRLLSQKTALFNIDDDLKYDSQIVMIFENFLNFIPNLDV